MQKAAFGAGCFWGVQYEFDKLEGVKITIVGYMGGKTINPSYEQVCSDTTGHAEAVYIEFDENLIDYEDLLNVFWKIHDPTQKNKQGPDIGSQYRSVIFYYNEEQKKQANKSKNDLDNSKTLKRAVKTEIVPATDFYKAEEYHQQYFKKNGVTGCRI